MLNKQKGTAIIIALFIMALIAATAIAMVQRFRIDLRRTELIIQATQGYFIAQGNIAFAIAHLNQAYKQQKPTKIIDDLSPFALPQAQEGAFTVDGSILDAQALFNINNLTQASYQPIFLRLIQTASPKIDVGTAQQISKAVIDWISTGLKSTDYDAYYLKLNPAYRSAHHPMASISELLLVKGMTPDLYNLLAPYLTALPVATPININNAPVPVLMSLSPSLPIGVAKRIEQDRKSTPYVGPERLTNADFMKNYPIPADAITVKSTYFLIQTTITVGDQKINLNTLVNRVPGQGNQSQVLTVWQSKGTL